MGSSPISRSTAPRPFPYRKRAGRCLSRRRGRLCGGLRQGSYPVKYLPEEDCRHHTDRLAAVRWAWCEIRLSWSGSSFLKTGCAGGRKIIPDGEKIIPNGPLALPIALCYTQIISDGDTVRTNTRFIRKKISFLLSTAAEHPVGDGVAASRTATSNSEKSAPGIGQIHSEQQNERMLLIITFS